MLSDLLFQPFCWLMFSHWTTNSANCGRASHTNGKQGTAARYLPHRNLDVWNGSRLSHRAHGVLRGSLGQNERAHREKQRWGRLFSISTTRGVMKGTYTIKSFCSPNLEFHMLLCRPFWLPREFTAIITTAVYIPPQANTDQALKELYKNISEQETAHPDAVFVVRGDFNKANFRTIAPKYFQHITINTCGDCVLDHCYSPFRDAYKSLPRPPFGKSAYMQKLKQEHSPMLIRPIGCYTTGLF